MKFFKYAIVAAACAFMFSSCIKREFEPEVGNGQVEFAPASDSLSLDNPYILIKLQQTKPSDKAAKAVLVIDTTNSTVTLSDGTKRALSIAGPNADLYVTQDEVFVSGYTQEEMDANGGNPVVGGQFEIRIGKYKSYKAMDLKLAIKDSESSYDVVIAKPKAIDITGTYALQCSIWPEPPATTDIVITVDPSDPNKYYFGALGVNNVWTATRDANTLTISNKDTFDYEGKPVQCCSCDGSSYDPNTCAEIAFTADEMTLINGMFLGIFDTGSGFILAKPGDKGAKK